MTHGRVTVPLAVVTLLSMQVWALGDEAASAANLPQPTPNQQRKPYVETDDRVELLINEVRALRTRVTELEQEKHERDEAQRKAAELLEAESFTRVQGQQIEEIAPDDPQPISADEISLDEPEFVDYGEVDLDELDEHGPPTHVLAKRWFENFNMSGFAAFNILGTGKHGSRREAGFMVKESTIWIEPQVWDDTSFFVELQMNRLNRDNRLDVRTGEVHAHLRNIWQNCCGDSMGLKVGRVDIPFGEEYLSQDSIDNKLITQSAAYPYGYDEGVVLYGTYDGVGWILAATDGSVQRSIDDDVDKAVNAKLYGSPSDHLYLSASFMRNGESRQSAFEFAGSQFQPVGTRHRSSLGNSPSRMVDAILYELDAKLQADNGAYLGLAFGQAFVDDAFSQFNRSFLWYILEAYHPLSETTYAVARFSEIGTHRGDQGYRFGGKITARGQRSFGYDTRRFQRLSVGLGWKPNSRTVFKAELGQDWFNVINGSRFRPNNDHRWHAGLELVVGF